ncbi:MAG: carboxypeptidase regulatory-like domain-containing protein, partial [Pseudonocardiales bacterium]|nr:carboxypeptidase regulatory-like domain-containing protein [Pseudonocardiales bacterium]
LTVTIAMSSLDEPDQFPVVQTLQLEPASLVEPALAGRVLDPTLAPVAGAKVTVVETGEARTVGADAAFRFESLAFGRYTLLVQAENQQDVREEINYAADSQVHNVILPPQVISPQSAKVKG